MQNKSAPQRPPALATFSRRRLFAGASTLGALGALAALSTRLKPSVAPAAAVQPPQAPVAHAGGYSLSEHVKRYYQTTRL